MASRTCCSPHRSRTHHARGGRVTRRGGRAWVLRPPPTPYRSPGEPFPLWAAVSSSRGAGRGQPDPCPPPRRVTHPVIQWRVRQRCGLGASPRDALRGRRGPRGRWRRGPRGVPEAPAVVCGQGAGARRGSDRGLGRPRSARTAAAGAARRGWRAVLSAAGGVGVGVGRRGRRDRPRRVTDRSSRATPIRRSGGGCSRRSAPAARSPARRGAFAVGR